MAFPEVLDPTTPAGTDSPAQGDDQFTALKTFLQDLFGLQVSPTTYPAAVLQLPSTGGGQSFHNLLLNPSFEFWASDTTTVPPSWTLTGAGATVARNSTATQFKHGAYSFALTRVGTDCYASQDVLAVGNPNLTGNAAYVAGRTYTFMAWVRATVATRARLTINDGVGTTSSGYHTGGSSFELLTVTRTLDASATMLQVRCGVDTGNTTAQFDGCWLVEGSMGPGYAPGLSSLIGARVANSANISVANNTVTSLTFDTDRYDTGDFHSTSVASGRLTAPVAGKYLIVGNIELAARTDFSQQLVRIRLNGATVIGSNSWTPAATSSSNANTMSVSTCYALAAADYVELQAFHQNTAAAAVNVDFAANYSPEFMIAYIGP